MTTRIWRAVRGVLATTWVTGVLLATSVAAQGESGFHVATPEELAQGQERLPATPLVFAAYAVVWVVLLVYVWSLWRRLGKVERELRDVTAKLESRSS